MEDLNGLAKLIGMLPPLPPQRKGSIEVGNRVVRRDSGGRGSRNGPLERLRLGRPHAARQLAVPHLAASRGRGEGEALCWLPRKWCCMID